MAGGCPANLGKRVAQLARFGATAQPAETRASICSWRSETPRLDRVGASRGERVDRDVLDRLGGRTVSNVRRDRPAVAVRFIR